MIRRPVGPATIFASQAFCSSGVGFRFMSMPGKKYIPEAGTAVNFSSSRALSGRTLMPIAPSGVAM
jgi:hypothetical protein